MSSLEKKRAAERARLGQLIPPDIDPHSEIHGVLLSDEIAFYADNHQLITPFDRSHLKPAAYELTIGKEYFLHGEFLTLDESGGDKSKITIPPFEVAVLRTTETLCLPRYLIARWNIKVKHAYSGLLWVGGPQVDPGWVGQLSCPIYNLSDKPVTLHVGEEIAVIDFVKTTQYDPNKNSFELKRYKFPPNRVILEDYNIDELRSALFTKAGVKLLEFEEQINNLGSRFNTFTQISLAIFGLVIALVITSRVGAENISLVIALTGAGTLALSIFAVLTASFSYVHWRVGRLVYEQFGILMQNRAQEARRFLRRAWWSGIAVSTLVAVAASVSVYLWAEPFLRDIRQGHVLTKADLDTLSVRVEQMERNRPATVTDLEKLRAALEQEIQTIKSSMKPGDR